VSWIRGPDSEMFVWTGDGPPQGTPGTDGRWMETSSKLVANVLLGEERRFAGLLTRGRKVLAQLGPGRALTDADFRYLHQTHGLPPELVTELLAQPTCDC
jgi:alanyl-tRNA synthetase